MIRLTVYDVMNLNPCYSLDRVEAIWDGQEALSLLEIAALDEVSAVDRLWVLLRPEHLGQEAYEAFGYEVADRAVRAHCLDCGTEIVESWAREWLSGEDRSRDAADAAYAAAHAAYAADAARAAAHAAYAAAHAASDAERIWQLSRIVEILESKS